MAAGALGDPRPNGGTGYALCVGEGDGRVVFRATVPAGGRCGSQPCWKTTKDGGFRFKGVAGAPIRSVVVVPAGKRGARAGVVAFGRDLLAAGPPLALPVTVQLEAATGACWSATFTSARTRAGRFTAATSR
jgi:hypothetical protein